jgi:hypothetical protein
MEWGRQGMHSFEGVGISFENLTWRIKKRWRII